MPNGNDFCNNQLINAVLQNASTDEERGYPELGKIVYRTDTELVEICVDTDPDPGTNGGGTWNEFVGGGGGPVSWTPLLVQDTTTITVDNFFSFAYRVGDLLHWQYTARATMAGPSASLIQVTPPPLPPDTGETFVQIGQGKFYDLSSTTLTDLIVYWSSSGSGRIQFGPGLVSPDVSLIAPQIGIGDLLFISGFYIV